MKKSVTYKPLSNEEYKQVYNFHPLTDLMLNTGARIMEIKRIIDEWRYGETYVDIKTKKSGESTNRIYLNDKSIECIKNLQAFKNKNVKAIQRKVNEISNDLGIEFTSHCLRATFATRLLSIGVDLVTVQHLMNHSDISVTALYIKFDENRLRGALNLIDEYDTYEGMSVEELKNEIFRLRTRLIREENK